MNKNISVFYKNVLTLTGGTTLSNVIPFLLAPILSRIFTPDDFGALAVFSSLSVILSSFISGKYELAILLPRKDSRANYLVVLAIMLSLFFCLLCLVIFVLFEDWFLSLLNFDRSYDRYLLYFIPFTALILSFIQVFNYQMVRQKRFPSIAVGTVIKTGSINATQLSAGLLNYTNTGLITGFIFGNTIGAISFGYSALKGSGIFSQRYRRIIFKKMALIYSDFPRYSAMHSLTNTTSSNLPQLMLNSFFSQAIAGLYGFSTRICFTPIRLLSASIQQVFSQSITEQHQKGANIHAYTVKAVKQVALIGLAPFLILMAFAPQIFSFVFSEVWYDAGIYAQILTPYLYLVFVITPITFIPMLLNRQRKAFVIDLCYLVLRVIALVIGGLLFNPIIAISLFSFVGFIVQLYVLFWILKIANKTTN